MLKALPRVVIIGGGFTAASLAVQLLRRSAQPLAITIIEPRERLGPGLAYSGADPDHRLNAPTGSHSLDPLDPLHLSRWCTADGLLQRDPEAAMPNGLLFIRRLDYGRYLEDSLRQQAAAVPAASLRHCQDRAVRLESVGGLWRVQTAGAETLFAEVVVLATGNPPPALQWSAQDGLSDHPRLITNPLLRPQLPQIDPDARVLVLGTALTAQDMISTLVRRGHRGPIVAVSRRALVPRPHAPELMGPVLPASLLQSSETPLDRIMRPLPDFLAPPVAPTALAWTRALRGRIAVLQAQGLSWHAAFDDLREAVWRAWPLLPVSEKRRFLRRLRPWYDVHRFRSVPFNDAIVARARAQGLLSFRRARLVALRAARKGQGLRVSLVAPGQSQVVEETFDWLINCTGLDPAAGIASNAVLASLRGQGDLVVDGSGIGIQVDPDCRVLGSDGRGRAGLFAFGPPTAGVFGDPLGALFISAQIHRALPGLLQALEDDPASRLACNARQPH